VTGLGVAGNIKLPYNYTNGSSVYLGDPGPGYPPQLYPNLTYGANHSNATSIHGTQLSPNTTLLLGPLTVNETFSLFSITVPVNNIWSRLETLGWITVVLDSSLLYDIVSLQEGLSSTGEVLILGPNHDNNRFSWQTRGTATEQDANQMIRFILPPPSNASLGNRHSQHSWLSGNFSAPFPITDYPSVLDAWTRHNDGIDNAGALISTQNEQNLKVSTGFAVLSSVMVDWVLVVEQSYGTEAPNFGKFGD